MREVRIGERIELDSPWLGSSESTLQVEYRANAIAVIVVFNLHLRY